MFGGLYDQAFPSEKPKYGCFNVAKSDSGCQMAVAYFQKST